MEYSIEQLERYFMNNRNRYERLVNMDQHRNEGFIYFDELRKIACKIRDIYRDSEKEATKSVNIDSRIDKLKIEINEYKEELKNNLPKDDRDFLIDEIDRCEKNIKFIQNRMSNTQLISYYKNRTNRLRSLLDNIEIRLRSFHINYVIQSR